MSCRHNARKKIKKRKVSKVKFIITFNPGVPSIEGLIRKDIHCLHSDKKSKRNDSTFFIPTRNLVLKVIVLLLAVTNVTFVRTF